MKVSKVIGCITMAFALVFVAAVRAEVQVELKGVHLCCGQCVSIVGGILKKEGAKGKCDQKAKTVTITAEDAATAQKAVDAVIAAGFFGETDSKDVKVKNDSGVEAGKVKALKLTGAHNCCGACCKAIKETVKKVDGVTSDTATPKGKTFEVKGDFDAQELVKALNAAGLSVRVVK